MARGRGDVIMPVAMSSALPLAAFWFLFLGGLGVIFPYQSLYFSENVALLGTQLGLVLAVRPLVGMLAQPLWGQLADRTGSRTRTLVVLAAGTAPATCSWPRRRPSRFCSPPWHSPLSSRVRPCRWAPRCAWRLSGARAAERFGKIRVWGTVGFFVLVVGFPLLLHRIQASRGLVREPGGPSEPGLELIFYVAAALSLAAACVAWRLPRNRAMAARSRRGDLRLLLRHRPYRRLLCFVFLAHLCLQAPFTSFRP